MYNSICLCKSLIKGKLSTKILTGIMLEGPKLTDVHVPDILFR
jgi:hypothetical protein